MKKILLTMALLMPAISGASALESVFTCDGGKQVNFDINSLTVDSQRHAFIDGSHAAGQHEDGTNYPAMAYEFEGGWVLVLADGSNESAVLVHEDDIWFCENKARFW